MTTEAMRALKYLRDEGETGQIEAHRIFPHAFRFKLARAKGHADVPMALATIDQLVTAKAIEPTSKVDLMADRYFYRITAHGREMVDAHEAEKKRARDERARQAERRH